MSVLDRAGGKHRPKTAETKERAVSGEKAITKVEPFVPKPFNYEGMKRTPDGRRLAKGTAPGPGRRPGPQGVTAIIREMTSDGLQLQMHALEALGGYLRKDPHPTTGEVHVLELGYKEMAEARAFLADRGLLPKQAHITHDVNRTETVEVQVYQMVYKELSAEERIVYAKIEALEEKMRAKLSSGSAPENIVDGEVIG
jgi:hypothetical protein